MINSTATRNCSSSYHRFARNLKRRRHLVLALQLLHPPRLLRLVLRVLSSAAREAVLLRLLPCLLPRPLWLHHPLRLL